MTARPPQEWRVHVGAHKTATTHLQQVLEALAPELQAQGVRVIPTAPNRRPARRAANLGRKGHGLLWRSIALRLQSAPELRRVAGDAAKVVYSEEDFLGWATDLLSPRFYPRLTGLDLLPVLARRGDLSAFVSFRAYDRLLPSAVFQCLHVRPDAVSLLDPAVDALLSGNSGWFDLMQRIETKLPSARLGFWTQESYARASEPIVSGFLGFSVPLPDLPIPAATASPSARALEEIARLDPNQPRPDWRRRVEEIYTRHPAASGGRAELIPPAKARALQDLYARHLEQLRARYEEIGVP